MSYRTSHAGLGPTYDQRLAKGFDAYMTYWDRVHLERILKAGSWTWHRYLDFACGTGRITEIVAPFARVSVGVDIDESMVEKALEEVPGVDFHVADLTEPVGLSPVGTLGHFGLVTAFRFFGNAEQSLRVAALEAIAARQPIGGTLILNNHRSPWALAHLRNQDDCNRMDLSHRKMIRLLRDAGYRIEQVIPVGAWKWRSRLMMDESDPGSERNRWREQYFSDPFLAHIAPNTIYVAVKK